AEAERKAAVERRAEEERRLAAERQLAAERARREEEERARLHAQRADASPPSRSDRRTAEASPPRYRVPPNQGGPAADSAPNREEWLRRAASLARKSGIVWLFDQSRDKISDDLLLRAQAVFPAGANFAIEIAFECNIGAGKRLKAYARAFDVKTKATVALPLEEGQSSVVRGTVTLDDGAPQTAFMFPESGARQASIVEVPVTHEDIRKNTPRGQVWLRYFQVTLQLKLAANDGEVVANIHPYDDKLRRVLEGCSG
ncbi:MAG: hypothetical protein KIT16_23240, partial [Rhodospirillaceae bacterium]|nr:hypothetical protein [Rhodospirillaceae bacterium]